MKTMTYALIDLENIGSLKNVQLANYERLYIFCGAKQDTITLNGIPTCSFKEVKIFSRP